MFSRILIFFIKMKADKIINDFICFRSKETKKPWWNHVKANLFQKLLFLHQFTQNITKDCSLNYKLSMYMRTASSEHVVYINNRYQMSVQKQKQFVYTTCSELVVSMYWTRNSMNNLLSYCGLVDASTSASEKDLPVKDD